MKSRVVIVLRGFPGAGKSTLAKNFINEVNNFVIVDPDLIDSDIYLPFPAYLRLLSLLNFNTWLKDNIFRRRKYLHMLCQTLSYLEAERNVLWVQVFSVSMWIDKIYDYLTANTSGVTFFVIELSLPIRIAQERISTRLSSGGHGNTNDPVFSSYQTICSRRFKVLTLNANKSEGKLLEDFKELLVESNIL